jgi:hypothetical protein
VPNWGFLVKRRRAGRLSWRGTLRRRRLLKLECVVGFVRLAVLPASQLTGVAGRCAATDGGRGMSLDGSVAVSPGVLLYQITGAGLAAQLTISGTKYHRNDELN